VSGAFNAVIKSTLVARPNDRERIVFRQGVWSTIQESRQHNSTNQPDPYPVQRQPHPLLHPEAQVLQQCSHVSLPRKVGQTGSLHGFLERRLQRKQGKLDRFALLSLKWIIPSSVPKLEAELNY
jgi:hypothetical protein